MYQRAVIRCNICKLKNATYSHSTQNMSALINLYEMLCHQLAFNEALKRMRKRVTDNCVLISIHRAKRVNA